MQRTEPAAVRRLRCALTRFDAFMAGSALLVLLLVICGQILLRNLFASGLPSADIIARYMVLYVSFFGAALAIEHHRHIRLDVLACFLDPKQVNRLRPFLYLLSAAICSALAWGAMRFWYDDWQYVAAHERWASVLALITPFGFSLLTLHFLLGALFPQRDSETS